MSLKTKGKAAWGCTLLLAAVSSLATGCSGISATKSVSPLDFILPGLTGTDTNQEPPVAQAESPVRMAAYEAAGF